ncbi:hypothetical protein CHM34_16745 [Paludifilum halophilum]|uniref:Uncharacterized protein n=1 Tax=Paludifilum halophilum TaxID=1642702 RepID=A0A235B320_9BACL|nr:hypothetical protein CHM34_16745 [Paludifilum halophilum]
MILAHPWWVGVGFHTPFRCSDEPKALRVEPHPPEQETFFHNASKEEHRRFGRRRLHSAAYTSGRHRLSGSSL